ncbi:PAS domain-containing protein [Enterovirga rhinocerotis]|uniref:histidine kinase n=1 Tax=Enterovirga rhinocerotis TaxID=1339210 RepID=A0A4R7C9D8_9HYPH|nr:PAS domain-containing protein [Enterovirga rhinocerotis]TDR94913.1 PAS domain S-box-containing protein [Enterovirga rhinocerotis]
MVVQFPPEEVSEVLDGTPPIGWTEPERLAALAEYGILDTAPEIQFDDIARLATRLFDVPVALVSLVADDRQWFKAEVGLGLRETSLDVSICKDAIRHPGVFVVCDLAGDPCYASNPLVASESGFRFYASAKLETPEGRPLGAVAILDRRPRPQGISEAETASLEALARQVMSHLELRRAISARDRALVAERAGAQRYTLLANATRDAIWDWDLDRDSVVWNEALHDAHGYSLDDVAPTGEWWMERIHPDDRERIVTSIQAAIDGRDLRWASEYRFRQADGAYADIFDRGSLIRDEDGRARRMVGAMLDLTERNRSAARRGALAELGERLRELDDPAAIAFAAAETMGRVLRVERAGYASVEEDSETILVERDWVSEGGTSHPGRLHFRDFGTFIDDLKRGETVVIADVRTDARTSDCAEAMEAKDIGALVNLPVIEQGRLVAIFYLNQSQARSWTEGDLAFVRNVADSTRAATERARSMAALRASEELFRVFAQAMPNQVWAADASGRIDWLNRQAEEYFGSSVQQSSENWAALLHLEDRSDAAERWHHSVATGEIFETELRLRRHDGAYRWFLARALAIPDEQGAIRRWIGTNTDVDEQKEIAAELAQVNALLASRVEERTRERDRLWSTTSDLMGTAGPNGLFTSVNPAWTRMLGWSESELLALPPMEFVVPEDREEVEAIAARLVAGEAIESYANRLRTRDGGTRTIMWNAVPDRGAVYFVGRDITDQREVEDQLRQAQKMEAVGQLTGGIAHDFNNLLTGIIGSLDLLQTRLRQGRTENLDRYLKVATNSANRAAALTHRLLAFARRQPLDARPVDVNALVTSLEDLLRRSIGEAIGLSIETEPNLWPTHCDANQLESAILNLAINARDAMPEGGQLRIVTDNTFLDSHAATLHPEVRPGPYVSISVIDTGLGMAPDVIKRAFDPFFTTKPQGQGTGLGLSMVYGFARQSDGLARIASEPGRGTTITLYLPRHDSEAAVSEAPASHPAVSARNREETVLVVEDETMVRDLVVEILGEMGLRVIQAVDGASGLKVLSSGQRIDLLVSDIGLPGMNGRQMVDEARTTRPDLPVLFITGYAQNAALAGFLRPGMEMMTKPFTADGLATRVRGMLEG